MFEYSARLVRVIDGDTMIFDVDLGFDVWKRTDCRLVGINAPEKNTPEGVVAREYAVDWFTRNTTLTIQTMKDKQEKYGRYLAVVVGISTLITLNDEMVHTGHAVPYDGGKR